MAVKFDKYAGYDTMTAGYVITGLDGTQITIDYHDFPNCVPQSSIQPNADLEELAEIIEQVLLNWEFERGE